MGKDLRGKELGMGFSQRKDGRYEARAVIEGKKIDLYDTSITRLRKSFDLEKARILREEGSTDPNIVLSEWFTEWFDTCKAKQLKSEMNRHNYYEKVKNYYFISLGEKPVCKITQMDVQKATNALVDNGKNPERVKEALRGLRECFDSAVTNNITKINPCNQIYLINNNAPKKERRVLAEWEQKLLLEEAANSSYYYEVYAFLLSTGVRIGELSGLQWEDIDWEKKVIHIRRTMTYGHVGSKRIEVLNSPKTATSYRSIPFFGETEEILKSWKKKQEIFKLNMGDKWRANPEFGNLVFTNHLGSSLNRSTLVPDLNSLQKRMNNRERVDAIMEHREPRYVEHMHPHCFRHTFATRCFEKGMSPVVIKKIMGHIDYATTVSYTHVLNDKMDDEINRIGNFLE